MKIEKEKIFTSPSDLNNFTLCKYHIKNDKLSFKNKLLKRKPIGDLELIIELGLKHEKKHLNLFKNKYKKIKIINDELSENKRYQDTLLALKEGFKVIHKAFFIEDTFRGEVDFLIRVETESSLGPYSYEVWDTKIAKNPQSRHVLQITAYSFLLSKVQGLLPKKMYLISGDDQEHSYNVADFTDYFVYMRKIFLNFIKNIDKEKIYPEKCKHCKICRWYIECEKIWEKDNYLNQISGIRQSQIVRFKKEKIVTAEDLCKVKLSNPNLKKINSKTLSNLKIKACLVQKKRESGESSYKIIETENRRGLYKLPKPNPADVFIDLEGYPFFGKRGFEYLHGLYLNTGTKMEFKYFWANSLDREDEKKNFINLIEYLKKHFEKNPNAYLYHYNEYEKTALRNLSNDFNSAYPDGLYFVDKLQRLEKFVDLYRVVEQCMLTSEKDISLKTIEKFYKDDRKANIKSAAESVLLYNQWLASKKENLKQDIINYNRDDCISTYELTEFLRNEKKKRYSDIPWFSLSADDKTKHQEEKEWETKDKELIKNLEKKKNESNNDFINNLQSIVGFYRRERKPEFWAMYDRKDKEHEDLVDDTTCIANCIRTSDPPVKVKLSQLFKYKFQKQDYKLREGDTGYDILGTTSRTSNDKKDTGFNIKKITEKGGEEYLTLKVGKQKLKKIGEMPTQLTLGPGEPFKTYDQERAIKRYLDSILVEKSKNKYKCINDFLIAKFPDVKGIEKGKNLINDKEDFVYQTVKVINNLQSSCLAIQGPPGTGKTWISAKVIIELLKKGKKIGISSNSHKAINNLLKQIEDIAIEEKFEFKGVKKSSQDTETKNIKEDQIFNGKTEMIHNTTSYIPVSSDYSLFAGTLWYFSYTGSKFNKKTQEVEEKPPIFDQSLDYMFCDEAGQVSLAGAIVLGTSSKNLILIGDQMQLANPIKGVHEGNSGKSCLEFLLENHDTIPLNKGIFLKETRRLNKKICKFISESFYESRLKPHEIAEKRKVISKIKDFEHEGIFYIPIDHKGCSTSSEEETKKIKSIYDQILGSKYVEEDDKGKKISGIINHNNIMTIAPFNVQVGRLIKELGEKAKVGTIDLFQGQSAKFVFISFASSDPENLPRQKSWFFSRNRLNVAVSRSESIVIIIFNPNLLLTACKKIDEMRLLNNFCKLTKFKTIL